MRLFSWSAIAVIVLATPVVAQARRQIPFSDTLGANFDIADTLKKQGAPTDYDALIGAWEFRFQSRRQDGSFNEPFAGHWAFEKKPGGLLMEDRWRADDPTAPTAAATYTYRAFSLERKIWQMLGTTTEGNEFALGLTWSDELNRYAIQRYGASIMRIRYFAIEPNRFLWRADRSIDGGATWLRDAWAMEVKRIGR